MTNSVSAPGEVEVSQAPVRNRNTAVRTAVMHHIVVAALLSAMVMVGLFLTNYSHDKARFYWTAMFPVFGLVSLWHSLRAHRRTMPVWRIVLRDSLHWLGAIVAVRIVFLQLEWGQMTADSAALMIVLLLAVTCFLAGVHLDPGLIWVSALLAGVAVVGTNVEGYLWVIVVVALVMLVIAGLVYSMIHRAAQPAPGPPPSS